MREICDALDSVARARSADPDRAGQVLRFLDAGLDPHLRDETEDLFPLLRRRCPPEDDIARALAGIVADLDAARDDVPIVREILAACVEAGRGPRASEATRLASFTRHIRRHLIASKAILLPLARARLTPRDLQSLSMRMQARRGITRTKAPPIQQNP
jgi:hypothetical protein